MWPQLFFMWDKGLSWLTSDRVPDSPLFSSRLMTQAITQMLQCKRAQNRTKISNDSVEWTPRDHPRPSLLFTNYQESHPRWRLGSWMPRCSPAPLPDSTIPSRYPGAHVYPGSDIILTKDPFDWGEIRRLERSLPLTCASPPDPWSFRHNLNRLNHLPSHK